MGFSAAVAGVMGGLAHARRGSAIHEVGTVYAGRLRTTGGGPGPFAAVGEQDVLVRLSRALGVPPPYPDVFGLGLRLTGPDGPQDLLLDSCRAGPLGRHTVVPRADVRAGPLGSLLALEHDGRTFQLAAFPRSGPSLRDTAGASGLVVSLATARPFGPWQVVGALRCDVVVEDQTTRLSPANAALGLRLAPWWERFRVDSYRASRRRALAAAD